MNLNYEGQWIESSKVLSLHGKEIYVGHEFYRRVAEHSCENVKSGQKDFFLFGSMDGNQGKVWSKKRGTEGYKNVNLTTDKNGVRSKSFRIISCDIFLRQPRISLAAAV